MGYVYMYMHMYTYIYMAICVYIFPWPIIYKIINIIFAYTQIFYMWVSPEQASKLRLDLELLCKEVAYNWEDKPPFLFFICYELLVLFGWGAIHQQCPEFTPDLFSEITSGRVQGTVCGTEDWI